MGVEHTTETGERYSDRDFMKRKLWLYCLRTVGWWHFFFPEKVNALYEKILRYPFSVAKATVVYEDHDYAVSEYNSRKRIRAKTRKQKKRSQAKARRSKRKK